MGSVQTPGRVRLARVHEGTQPNALSGLWPTICLRMHWAVSGERARSNGQWVINRATIH